MNQVLEYSQNRYVPNSFLTRPAWRAEGYYGFQTGPIRHAVTAGVTSEHYTFGTGPGMNYVAQSTNDPGVGNATAAILNTQTREQFLARYRALNDFTSVKRWDYSVPTVWSPTHNTSHFFDRTIYFNHNGEFFRGRLLTMFGILDVRSDRKGLVYNTSDGSLSRVSFMRQFPTEGRKPMFNATFKVTPSLSIYGNTSKSFSPEYSPRDGNMIPFQGSTAVNREVGLKWELFERKVLFSTAWFTNTRKDWPTTVPWIYNNDPEDNDSLPGFGNASILRDYEARGYEARVDLRILPNWTINGSYTHNPAKNTAVGKMVEPTREGFNIINGVPVPVPDPAIFLLGTNGTNQSINLFRGFTRYDVRAGPLKGLWMYFGAKYDGHRSTLTTTANVTAATLSAPTIVVTNRRVQPRLIFDLNVGFRHRVGKYRLNYQVNVANLLDYQDWYAAYWNAPRTVRFATDLSF